jgi:alpha-tubulin suppressor-like RCC1 family protein
VVAISGGEKHTVVLTKAGEMYSFGAQTYGMLGCRGADPNSSAPLRCAAACWEAVPAGLWRRLG